jgi:thiamine-monophosphate kinase
MSLAITTDMLVERNTLPARHRPRPARLESTGGQPLRSRRDGSQTTLGLACRQSAGSRGYGWIGAFAEGLFACASHYGVDVVGGDTTRGPLNLCLTALGELPAGTALQRNHAVPGDELWVSGQPGLAALGLAQLQGRTQLPAELARRCLDALQRPMARVELGLELRQRGLAHAAIDVSDGLLADLDHILKRSGVAAEVFVAQLPPLPTGVDPLLARQCQLAGGDDYELVFSAPPDKRAEITELAAQLALPLWRFGLVVGTGDSRLRLLDADGQAQAFNERGFDHFG